MKGEEEKGGESNCKFNDLNDKHFDGGIITNPSIYTFITDYRRTRTHAHTRTHALHGVMLADGVSLHTVFSSVFFFFR